MVDGPEKAKKKKKKQKSNQSSVDFVIVSQSNEVKEVVKKKKKKKREEDEDESLKKEKKKRRKEEKKPPREEKGEEEKVTNSSGVTRLFVGNCPWSIDDETLSKTLECDLPVVKYVTDKETKQFYGSIFVDVGDPEIAARVVAMNGVKCGGRPLKINYAPPRPGDVWPPKQQQGKPAPRQKTERPEGGSTKLFIGNVAYEAQEEDVVALFEKVAPDGFRAVRWLSDKFTNEFKGSGFLEFFTCEQADEAIAKLDGTDLKGRKIRLDYA